MADGSNHRVQIFTTDSRFIRTFGSKGTGPGELLGPHALVIDKDQRLYLAEDDNQRVSVFDHDGQFRFWWNDCQGGVRAWYKPHGMDRNPNGDVFVCNFYLPCYKLTAEGELLMVFSPPNPDAGFLIVHRLATDQLGNVYLTTRERSQRDRIVKFNNNGTFVTSWSPPEGSQRLECIAVDLSGRLYVTLGKGNPGVEVYGQQQ